jgi:lysophospholipase L1-like esterase
VRRKTSLFMGGTVALAAACLLATAGPAAAAPPQPPLGADTEYVALGSSFAAGPGIPVQLDPTTCGRSSNNYAHLLAQRLQLPPDNLTDASCQGATIGITLASQVPSVTPDTDLVTVTIGGNDVNYLLTLFANSCKPGAAGPGVDDPEVPNFNPRVPEDPNALEAFICTQQMTPARIQAALDGLTAQFIDLIDAIRSAADDNPDLRIVLVDYLTILPQNGKPCQALPTTLTREEIGFSLDVARQLQLATKHAAQQTGVELVELSKASRHHDVCSATPWVNSWDLAPTAFGSQYHPNAAGMSAAADIIYDQLT